MNKHLDLKFKYNPALLGEMKVWHMSRFGSPMDFHLSISEPTNVDRIMNAWSRFSITVVHFRSELEMSMFTLQFGEHGS